MARIIVTGSSGLLGRHVLRRLAGRHEVFAVSRSRPEETQEVTWIPLDMGAGDLDASLPGRADAIVHLAQCERFRDFPTSAREVFEVNVGGTARLLDWGHRAGVRRFVYTSTGGVYRNGSGPLSEDAPLGWEAGPLSFYFASKRSSELLVEGYRGLMETVIFRPFFIYGAGQSASMLVPRLIASVREGRPIVLDGTDGISINPIHASDAAAAVEGALGLSGHHCFNLAGPSVLSLREIGEVIGSRLGRDPLFEVRREAPPKSMVADISRLVSELGAPRVGFIEGLEGLL